MRASTRERLKNYLFFYLLWHYEGTKSDMAPNDEILMQLKRLNKTEARRRMFCPTGFRLFTHDPTLNLWGKQSSIRDAAMFWSPNDRFIILSNGLASVNLQNSVNYLFRIAIYGEYSECKSNPLQTFISESNWGRGVYIVSSAEDGAARLSKQRKQRAWYTDALFSLPCTVLWTVCARQTDFFPLLTKWPQRRALRGAQDMKAQLSYTKKRALAIKQVLCLKGGNYLISHAQKGIVSSA